MFKPFENIVPIQQKINYELINEFGIETFSKVSKYGNTGIYLLLCGEINDDYRVFKPGVANTNLKAYTKTKIENDFANKYFELLKKYLNIKNIKMTHEKANNNTALKALNSRNGTVSKNSRKVFTTIESKENFLPVLQRYQCSIYDGIFIENALTIINKSYEPEDKTKLKFNRGKLYYNGYTYKAYYTKQSGNETESKILVHNYDEIFKYVLQKFKTVALPKSNNIKYEFYNKFYSQFDNDTEENINNILTDKEYKQKYINDDVMTFGRGKTKQVIKINYSINIELNTNENNYYIYIKNNKLTYETLIKNNFINLLIKLIIIGLIEFENGKIMKYY